MSQNLAHEEYLYLYDSLPGLLSMAWAIWQRFHGDVYRIQDQLATEHQAKGLAYRWSMPHRSFYTCPVCGHQDTSVKHILHDAANHQVELSEEAVHAAREHSTPFPEEVRSFLAELAAGENTAPQPQSATVVHNEERSEVKGKLAKVKSARAQKTMPDLTAVRDRLIAIMRPFEKGTLKLTITEGWDYGLAGPATAHSIGKAVWFGGVNTTKKYVSYYLMPVYSFPDLLEGMSPELKKRMQGKSCWNFRVVDEMLLAELAAMTKKAYRRYVQEKWIVPAK